MQVKSGILLFLSILSAAYSIATLPAEADVSLTRKDVLIAGGSIIIPTVAYKWGTDPLRRLCWAIELGDNPQAVDTFVKQKEKMGLFSPKNYSPLHHMVARGRTQMIKKYIEANKLTAKNIQNIMDGKYRNVLQYASHCSYPDIVRYLVDNVGMEANFKAIDRLSSVRTRFGKIEISALDELIKEPLDYADQQQKKLMEYCAISSQHKSQKHYQFFLDLAVKNQEVIDFLRKRGGNTLQEKLDDAFEGIVNKDPDENLLQMQPLSKQTDLISKL